MKASHTNQAEASKVIRSALRRVKKVKRLLHELGDTDEHVALSNRFRRMQRHLENSPLDPEKSPRSLARLTLAAHGELNVLLSSESFYPAA